MICVSALNDPLICSFFSDYDEATTLLIYYRSFGSRDVVLLRSSDQARIEHFTPYKFLSKRRFDRFVSTFRPSNNLEQQEINFDSPCQDS